MMTIEERQAKEYRLQQLHLQQTLTIVNLETVTRALKETCEEMGSLMIELSAADSD